MNEGPEVEVEGCFNGEKETWLAIIQNSNKDVEGEQRTEAGVRL